jgi:hypothetical protein
MKRAIQTVWVGAFMALALTMLALVLQLLTFMWLSFWQSMASVVAMIAFALVGVWAFDDSD